jgi:F-type H+-transporting ATPase subunit b
MQFDWWTLGLQTINFAILVWLMHRFLYKPTLKMLDARQAEIDAQYAEAKAAEAKAKERLAEIEAERAKMMSERETLLNAATQQAEELAKARRAQAEIEAATTLDETRKTLAAERDKALAEAKKAALDLGASIARRFLSEAPQKLRTEAWLEKIEQYLATLPASEKEALARQVNDGGALAVATASPLPSEATEIWRTRLRRALGDGIALSFEVDADLIAGAELRFPTATLSFSLQDALATVRSEIAA